MCAREAPDSPMFSSLKGASPREPSSEASCRTPSDVCLGKTSRAKSGMLTPCDREAQISRGIGVPEKELQKQGRKLKESCCWESREPSPCIGDVQRVERSQDNYVI